MKKMLISLILLIPMLTGCANVQTGITINNDKSADVITTLAYNGDLNDSQDIYAQNIIANYEKLLDKNYKTEINITTETSTIKAAKGVQNIQKEDLDLSSLGFETRLSSGRFIDVKKNFLITSYNIDCVYDYAKQAERLKSFLPKLEETVNNNTSSELQPEYYQKYGDPEELEAPDTTETTIAENLDEATKQAILDEAGQNNNQPKQADSADLYTGTVSIKVPAFASYNNADNSKGTTYNWIVKKDSPTVIKLQYVRYSGFAIAFTIILGALLLIILAGKIFKHETQKRMDNVENIV